MKLYNLRWGGFRRNSLLLKIFSSLLLISVLVVIFLTISMFYWFRGKTIDDLNKNNQMTLQNTNVVFSNYIGNVQNLTLELFQNAYVKRLMLQNNLDLDESNMNLVNQIQNVLSVNQYINSVYILNSSDTILRVSKLHATLDSEKNLFSTVSKREVSAGPLFWSMQNRYDENEPIKTMTVYYHEGVVKNNNFGGAVVININMDMLRKNIFSDSINSKQKLYIIDNKGNIILHNDMANFNADISSEPYIQKILNSKEQYATFNMKVDGKNNAFSYIPVYDGKFYIISQMENVQSISDLVKATNYILIINFIIFLFTIFISAFIAYKLYRPFENIMGNIKKMFGDLQVNNNLNEMQFLSNTFTRMAETLNSLEKENENNAIVNALSSNTEEGGNALGELLLKAGALSDDSNSYFLAVMRIDGYTALSASNSPDSLAFLVNSVSTIVCELISKRVKCCSYQIASDQIVLIISENSADESLQSMEIAAIMEEARDTVLKILSISVTIGLSSVSKNIQAVHEKFTEAQKCTDYRIFLGKGAVIANDMIAVLSHTEIPESSADTVINSVKRGNLEEYEISLDQVFDTFKSYTYEKSVSFLTNMAVAIIELISDFINEEHQVKSLNYLDIYNTIKGFQDKEDLKKWFIDLFMQTSSVINDINGKKVQSILIDIIEFINQHYCDAQLSANLMADRLSISTQYFSKIFNDFSGCSFPDYVNRIRLEKAKEMLLENKEADIKEIAQKVGFGSSTYFTTAFKKKYGVAPSKLRLSEISK